MFLMCNRDPRTQQRISLSEKARAALLTAEKPLATAWRGEICAAASLRAIETSNLRHRRPASSLLPRRSLCRQRARPIPAALSAPQTFAVAAALK
jgi:hypothetical protein